MLVMPDSTSEAMIGSCGGSPRALACAAIQAAICSFGASSPGYLSEPPASAAAAATSAAPPPPPVSTAAGGAGALPGGGATGGAATPGAAGGADPVPPMRMNF